MQQFWICFFSALVFHFFVNVYYKNKEIRMLDDEIKHIRMLIDADNEIKILQQKINKRIDELLNQN